MSADPLPASHPRRFYVLVALAVVALLLLAALVAAKVRLGQRIAALAPQIEARQRYEVAVYEFADDLGAMVAARRGFVLTGEARYIDAFEAAAVRVRRRHLEMEPLYRGVFGADDLQPAGDAQPLAPLLQRVGRLDEHLTRSIALYRERPGDRAEHERLTSVGDVQWNAIRDLLRKLLRQAAREFDRESLALATAAQEQQRMDAALSVAAFVVLLGACGVALWEVRSRGAAQRALAAANAELESKVQRRTAKLRDSEQRYRRLVEVSADAILVCDADHTVTYANAAAFALVRAARPEVLLGRGIESLFAESERAWLTEWLSLLWAGPHKQGFRAATLSALGGTGIAVEVAGVSWDSPVGLQVQIVVHDLSALRAEQSAVREQLQFIDQLVDAIPAALSVRDEHGRYLRVNGAYARLHRCDPAAVRNRSVFEVLDAEAAHQAVRQDAAAMRSSEAVIYETRLVQQHLQACQLLSRALAIQRADGSLLGVVTVDTDVTELWLKDRALMHANAELEALSHRLIRSQEDERRRIARDLHDHVGQILTRLKMALQTLAARPPFDAAALRPALTLTDDALAHARSLTASLHPHSLEDLGLEAAVRRQLDNYVAGAIARVDLSVALQPTRSTPERELVAFRVIQEASTNAIKHADASVLSVACESRDGLLWITVRDDGEGFDTGSTVFDRQQRASLGIASMRERVAEMGGEFAIESTPGVGTAVRALLPW